MPTEPLDPLDIPDALAAYTLRAVGLRDPARFGDALRAIPREQLLRIYGPIFSAEGFAIPEAALRASLASLLDEASPLDPDVTVVGSPEAMLPSDRGLVCGTCGAIAYVSEMTAARLAPGQRVACIACARAA